MTKIAAAFIALALAACAALPTNAPETTDADDSYSPVSSESAAPTLQATAEEASEAPAGAVEILLTCCPDFEPKEATAQAGAVVFFLHNDNGDAPPALHNFVIGIDLESPPLAASPTLAQGESIVFTVSGIEAGTYTYWCTVAAPDGTLHSQAGMTGTLTVTQ